MNGALKYVENEIRNCKVKVHRFGNLFSASDVEPYILELYGAVLDSDKYEVLHYFPESKDCNAKLVFKQKDDWSRLTNENRTFRGNI